LIGVIFKPGQLEVVEEFFQLFKTAWEPYAPGRTYDVIVSTGDVPPHADTNLVVVYGPEANHTDARPGGAGVRRHGGFVCHGDMQIPIYGELLTFAGEGNEVCCVTDQAEPAGIRAGMPGGAIIRLGYDLFEEVRFLLSTGQPIEQAQTPTLDIHIQMLREWILAAGVPLIEVLPVPAGHSCAVCLTHDIDFVGIRRHLFDHTMWGFLYRATVGAFRNFARGGLSWRHLLKSLRAAASLPFVYAGWAEDFWEPFEWYLTVEQGIPATYFLIPFKDRAGQKVPGRHPQRRATAYDVSELDESCKILKAHGCEIGVHGIDSWHSAEQGREELARGAAAAESADIGVRMHWLLRDATTPSMLEQAGYAYDSTTGYNETIGYRAGTGQVFRPCGVQRLLELPMHIQDGALFYPQRLNLSAAEAERRCGTLLENARKSGGVLTLLWHDRSHAPERFWGDFYIRLIGKVRSMRAWFGTAGQVVSWFRQRRGVQFARVQGSPHDPDIRLCYEGGEICPPLTVRVYRPESKSHTDIAWNGRPSQELQTAIASQHSNFDSSVQLSRL